MDRKENNNIHIKKPKQNPKRSQVQYFLDVNNFNVS